MGCNQINQIPRFHKGYLPPENVEQQLESDRPDGTLTSGLRLSAVLEFRRGEGE